MSIKIRVNGREQELEAPLTVAELLSQLGFDRRKVAVERNLEIVPRSVHDQTTVGEGDRLEIVSFVGGG